MQQFPIGAPQTGFIVHQTRRFDTRYNLILGRTYEIMNRLLTISSIIVISVLLVGMGGVAAVGAHPSPHRSTCSTDTYISVTSKYTNDTPITGMYIALENATTGKVIATGYTPITFCVQPNVQYDVYANNWTHEYFQTWQYPPTSENPLSYGVVSGVTGELTALYTATP
jgi:hypothetical protein